MEAREFKQESQVAGTEVIDSKGTHWKVLKDIPFMGYQLAEPIEGEFYAQVDYGKQITDLSFSIKEALQGLVVRIDKLDQRIAAEGEPLTFNTNDFYIEDLNGVKTIRKR